VGPHGYLRAIDIEVYRRGALDHHPFANRALYQKITHRQEGQVIFWIHLDPRLLYDTAVRFGGGIGKDLLRAIDNSDRHGTVDIYTEVVAYHLCLPRRLNHV